MSDIDFLATLELFRAVSNEPKYKQIVEAVVQGIRANKFHNGDKLPSINMLSKHFSISRDTVQKAYELLREKGVVESAHGKGYTISNDSYNDGINVLVIFDVLNAYKEKIYNGIKNTLASQTDSTAVVDFYFHHYNDELLEQFLQNNVGKYEYYAVMLFENEKIKEYIKCIEPDKLLAVDRCVDYVVEGASRIAQDHYNELIKVLRQGRELIRKYDNFALCFPRGYYIPEVIKDGYRLFCKENNFKPHIIEDFNSDDVEKGSAYLVIEDFDLVTLVKSAREKELKVGQDVGVLSYNDTPLKEIIEGGVTVISIDFYHMGELVAEQILNHNIDYELVPTELIKRNTL